MMKTSAPRMFSSIWNDTSLSGKRRSRAWPTGTPRKAAISLVRFGWALPEKIFSSPNPVGMSPSPMRGRFTTVLERACFSHHHGTRDGWGGRIRTFEYGIQSPAPYRLATPHHEGRDVEVPSRSGPATVVQTLSLVDASFAGKTPGSRSRGPNGPGAGPAGVVITSQRFGHESPPT